MIKRTSLNLDRNLVEQAREVLGTSGTTDTVHRALADVVRREARRRLARRTFDDLTLDTLDALRRPRVRA